MKNLLFLLALMVGALIVVRRFIPPEVRKALGERMMGRMPEN